ncbi:MAG: RuBisCO large subunit C-terminal-like domain-containing protein [Pseudomonadota bacterium]
MIDRFVITYRLATRLRDEAAAFAQALALSQTMGLARSRVPSGFVEDVVLGRVESLTSSDDNSIEARISYSPEATSDELSGLIHLLIGTATLRKGVRVTDLDLGPLERLYPGPRFGIAGLRRLVSAPVGQMIAVPLGPQGMSAEQFADVAFALASAGPDLVIEQPTVSNQPIAPFFERVEKVQAAVNRANAASGRRTIYCPTVPGPYDQAVANATYAAEVGVGAVQVRPGLIGLDVARAVIQSTDVDLPVISDPSGLSQYGPRIGTGLSDPVLYAHLPRLLGADVSIVPGAGSPGGLSKRDFKAVADACLTPKYGQPLVPAPRVPFSNETAGGLLEQFGEDALLMFDGSVYRYSDGLEGAIALTRTLSGGG